MSFIAKILEQGGEIFEVGGTVRDDLLGRPHKDKDYLVRKLPLPRLKKILESQGRVLTVGKSFGVLKFRPHGGEQEFDIALPRTERSTGPGHRDFEVSFDENLPIEADLKRRDFTLNAMARALPSGEILDPFNGRQDLKNKILRQVFEQSFPEDPLRLLRGVQFAARFELSVEPITLEAMKTHAPLISAIAPERVIEEIGKLFKAQRPSLGFYLMKDTGLLPHVFPELQRTIGVAQPAKRKGDVFDHTMLVLDASRSSNDLDQPGDLEIMFASLFHDVGKPDTQAYNAERNRITFFGHQIVSTRLTRKWLKRYRANMLGINPDNVLSLVHNHMFETKSFYSEKAIRRFIQKIGQELIFKLMDLRIADKKGGAFPDKFHGIVKLKEKIRQELERKPPFGPKDLAINGHDLMTAGYPPGPLMGKILHQLVEVVLDEPEKNNREFLLDYVTSHFQIQDKKTLC